jgi:hypothetical protein
MISRFRHLFVTGPWKQANVEHKRLTDYLLRRLTDEDSARITERLFEEEGFSVELEAVERDLLDAYARNQLPAMDRTAIDRCLLTSESQREKLRFARALAGRKKVYPSRIGGYWLAAAGVLLVLAAGFVFQQSRSLRSEIAALRLKGVVTASARPADSQAISFLLAPVERGNEIEVLPADSVSKLIRLDFSLGMGAGEFADVRMLRAPGELVLQEKAVRTTNIAGSVFVSVWLPGGSLTPGSYSATAGQNNFAFRVLKSTN